MSGRKWDKRFLQLARTVSEWSKDPSSQIGAVIVRPDRTIASMGFNGFPRGMSDDPALYADRDFKIASVVHSEENAILSSHDQSLKGCTLYVSGLPPCASCASKIIQVGIARVVAYHRVVPARWAQNMRWAAGNLISAGILMETWDEKDDQWVKILTPGSLWIEGDAECDGTESCGCAA